MHSKYPQVIKEQILIKRKLRRKWYITRHTEDSTGIIKLPVLRYYKKKVKYETLQSYLQSSTPTSDFEYS